MKKFFNIALMAGVAASATFSVLPSQAADWDTCGASSTDAMGSLSSLIALGSCQVGDKIYSNFNSDLPGATAINISQFNTSQHTITAQRGSGLTGTKFNYTITVVGAEYLKTWKTDTASSLMSPGYKVTTAATNPAQSANITITGDPGPKGPFTFDPMTTTSDFSNTIENIDDPVQQITNTVVQTPGPLPILGAGAAFGFSRKLRGRIKASA